MSSSQTPVIKKEDGLDRLVKRMKTVFRRRKSKATPTSSAAGQGEASTSAPAQNTATPAAPAAPTAVPQTGRPVDHRREKAQALFAKYGLHLDDNEWIFSTVNPVERVEKPIRMRVRRQCHKCQTIYGIDKVCSKCNHHKCRDCPRIPPKKTKSKGKSGMSAGATDADKPKRKPEDLVTIPSKTGGQDLVRRPIKQRTRRFCHKCKALFPPDVKECAECKHVRCKRCPRDPAKTKKWPEGYPGDEEPESDDPSDDSQTNPPKEGEKATEPGTVQGVEDKMANLGIHGDEPGGAS